MKTLFLSLFCIATLCAGAQEKAANSSPDPANSLTIHVSEPGTLDSIWGKRKSSAKHFIITGYLNGSDIKALYKTDICKAVVLDLRDACFTGGGEAYLDGERDYNAYYTADYEVTTYLIRGFDKLETIILPKKTRNVGENAISGCPLLKTCIIPSTALYSLCDRFYSGCPELTSIKLSDPVPPLIIRKYSYEDPFQKIYLFVPEEAKLRYQQAPDWKYIRVLKDPESIQDSKATAEMLQDTTRSVQVDKPGRLKELLGKKMYAIENLTISGKINQDDLKALSSMYCKLINLDLSEAYISGDEYYGGERFLPPGVFKDFYKLKNITLPNNLLVIGEGAFSHCISLESVTLPASLEKIEDVAFYKCSRLVKIEIPEKIRDIGEKTFYGCVSLETVILPAGLEYLGYEAFRDCPELTQIVCKKTTPISLGESSFASRFGFENEVFFRILYVPKGAAEAYKKKSEWKKFKEIVEIDGLEVKQSEGTAEKNLTIHLDVAGTLEEKLGRNMGSVEDLILSGNVDNRDLSTINRLSNTLKKIDISQIIILDAEGNRVNKIPEALFESFWKLESIRLPDSIPSISSRLFDGCKSLASIEIPESVTSIESGAFSSCKSLTSVKIPDHVTSLEKKAFSYCTSLVSVHIPSGITNIADFTFDECISLDSIFLPEGVIKIGGNAFSFCKKLKTVSLPQSLVSIGNDAFSRCPSLTSITIPKKVRSIGRMAFYQSGLTSVSLPESLRSLGTNAFEECLNLESVTLSNGIYIIEENTFTGCRKLQSIVIPEGIRIIGRQAFLQCTSLNKIEIRGNLLYIGESAFTTAPLKEVRCYGTQAFRWRDDIFHADPDIIYYWDESHFKAISKEQITEFFIKNGRKMYVPPGMKKAYEEVHSWGNTKIEEDPAMEPYKESYCSLSVHVAESGTLESLLKDLPNDSIEKLSLSGNLNARDIWAIRNISRRLFVLDLSQANIVEGGGSVQTTDRETLNSKNNTIYLEMFMDWRLNCLVTLIFPSSVTKIEQWSFSGYQGIGDHYLSKTISIPRDLTSADDKLFDFLSPVRAIRMERETPPDIFSSKSFGYLDPSYCKIYVPVGCKAKYKATKGWKDFQYIIEDESLNPLP